MSTFVRQLFDHVPPALRLCRVASILVSIASVVFAIDAQAQEDIIIADFEDVSYQGWQVEGEAFGTAPARGTLPNQMAMDGFLGKGLVNSFVGGDDSIGKLTSSRFVIQRHFINFLIGGGKFPKETCIQLIVDGQVVRTATGPNATPGGSERLRWSSWDVQPYANKTAVIEIIDQRKGSWGHINVDHIVQSNVQRLPKIAQRKLMITHRYLHLPVKTGHNAVGLTLKVNDQKLRQFDVELAITKPEFWAYVDLQNWLGKELVVDAGEQVDADGLLDPLMMSDSMPGSGRYDEPLRPQFHFTSRVGWLNDPNGLVYHDGVWDLLYQHNPYGWNWGNMHWGHAVSSDLFHWDELGDVFHPGIETKGMAFSGSAVIDPRNTSGFQTGTEPVMIAALTDTGAGESIAYSNDSGKNWSMYDGNPVVKHQGRDPKIVWHEPTQRWCMAVYDEFEGKQWIAFYSSANLKDWKLESRIEGFYECPELFEITSRDEAKYSAWVIFAADGKYVLGDFDGRRFVPRHSSKHTLWYGNFYASQLYSNAPDNRQIQIGWGNGITFPGMPFNQQMTVPVD